MKKKQSPLYKALLPYLKNKYVLTLIGALVWISFFDRNDIITTMRYHRKLENLKKEKAYYEAEILKYRDDLDNLMSSPENMEKYGREEYLMKRDNEDVYVIIDESKLGEEK